MYHISVCSVEIVVHIKMILVDEIVLFIPVGQKQALNILWKGIMNHPVKYGVEVKCS